VARFKTNTSVVEASVSGEPEIKVSKKARILTDNLSVGQHNSSPRSRDQHGDCGWLLQLDGDESWNRRREKERERQWQVRGWREQDDGGRGTIQYTQLCFARLSREILCCVLAKKLQMSLVSEEGKKILVHATQLVVKPT